MEPLAKIIVTGFGIGYSRWAPGTCGSLLALVSAWLVPLPAWWILPAAALGAFVLGVPLSFWAEKKWGTDPPRLVWDEMAGQWLALSLLPKTAGVYLLSFLLFRFFDIVKPLGVFRVQELPGGWGVMLDDLVCGIYSNIGLQLFLLAFFQRLSPLARLWS